MSYYHSRWRERRDAHADATRRSLLRGRCAKMLMCMYVAGFSPETPNARAEAEQAFDLFFDAIEEEITRLPPCTEGVAWDNRRKQLLGK